MQTTPQRHGNVSYNRKTRTCTFQQDMNGEDAETRTVRLKLLYNFFYTAAYALYYPDTGLSRERSIS